MQAAFCRPAWTASRSAKQWRLPFWASRCLPRSHAALAERCKKAPPWGALRLPSRGTTALAAGRPLLAVSHPAVTVFGNFALLRNSFTPASRHHFMVAVLAMGVVVLA